MSEIDTSKMSRGKADAMEVTEDSRQTSWEHPSFAGELFMGRFRSELLWPFPAQSDEDAQVGSELLASLEKFLTEKVDAEKIDREQELGPEVIKGLADLGLFAMKIPKEYGGLGLSQVNYNRAIALVASHCGSTAVWLSAHQSIGVPQPLKLFGTPEQKKKWLPEFSKGKISAFALTEAEAGSDPARMATTATPSADGQSFVLNGEKLWCTNGLVADYIVVMARTPDVEKRGKMRKQITAFVVDTKTPGFEILHRCRFMGIRAIQNGLIRFNNLKVPRENILLGEGKGLKLALMTLNTGRLTLPAASAGSAKRCVAMSRRWAAARVQWGSPIAEHDAIAQKIADMAATTFAMEAVTWYASALADKGGADIRIEAAMAKLFCSEAAWRIVDETLQIRGGRGYETEASLKGRGEVGYPVERMLRDNRINLIIEGASEIMRLFIAREALDPHLKIAGALVNPKAAKGLGDLALTAVKAGLFYAIWYPLRWIPRGAAFSYSGYGKLAGHMAWVSRKSNKLARNLFHLMALNGPALERRQVLLGRVVDIGVELFATATACAYARHLAEKENQPSAIELADFYAKLSRRKVCRSFSGIWSNEDKAGTRLSKQVVAGRYAWLERGVMPTEEFTK
jgi:alkylation response protein AidB-like acyl-CoA dehydrogenase